MFDIMQLDGFYAHVISPISQLQKKLVGFAFVDDTDLCVYGPHVTSQNMIQAMQQSVDNWEGLLHATGGTLISSKCFWYGINFKWENNNWVYANPHQTPEEVMIKDADNKQVVIPCLATSEACRTLGVRLALDSNCDKEVEYLVSIVADWKVQMVAARLKPTNATFSLKNVVLRKLCYPLVTTTFSKSQCQQIMNPIL